MRLPLDALRQWGFRRDPFADEPAEFTELYWSASHLRVRDQIVSAVNNADGIAVAAPVGWGKTVLWYGIEDLISHDDDEGYIIIRVHALDKERIRPNLILRAMYQDLEGNAPKQIDSEALTRTVTNLLVERARKQRKRIVLVVDEAHRLAPQAFRTFKNLLDIRNGMRRVIAIVLLGQEELGVLFRSHGLREVGARFALIEPDPLSPLDHEVDAFIRWRCFVATQGTPPIDVEHALKHPIPFKPEAIAAIEQELSGDARPDLLAVQTVANHAMVEAWNNRETEVTDQHVRNARRALLQGVF